MYAGFNALQSSVILFSIARNKELSEAGIVTIGFALAAFFTIIARFGVRNYQVTDVHEEHSFTDYFYLRIITVTGTFIVAMIYVTILIWSSKYNLYKGLIVLEIIVLKLVDAFEGLYVGRFQQIGRLDIGARIATIRIVISTVIIFVLIWFVNNLLLCFLIGIISSIGIDIFMIIKEKKYADFSVITTTKKRIYLLIGNVVPLCLGAAFHNYIGNAPKYLVDYYLSDDMQAISGYIMMPMFVIAVLNSFLMQPTVKTLGDAWDNKGVKIIRKLVIRHVVLIGFVSLVVMILGIIIGLPLLSWMYKVDLMNYRRVFFFVMIGGTLYTLSSYVIVILTTIREQNWIVVGCIISFAVYIIMGKRMVNSMELIGASYLYIISNLVLLAVFSLGVLKKRLALKKG